jgi:hypothetical protein
MKKELAVTAAAAIATFITKNFTKEQLVTQMVFIINNIPDAAPAVRDILAPKLGVDGADLQA